MRLRKDSYSHYSDEILVNLLQGGDCIAFEIIYKRYWKKLFAVAHKRVAKKDTCEEFVQDIFTSLWLKRESTEIKNLSAYLHTAVKYKVINFIHHEIVLRAAFHDQGVVEMDNSAEEAVLLGDLELALKAEVNKLPTRCQQVFKLSKENNLSAKQVATKLGISESTVENQLTKAMKLIRGNLRHFTYLLILSLFLSIF
jgi:RNA polymerase sigma-70 factor (ECF subfamily)